MYKGSAYYRQVEQEFMSWTCDMQMQQRFVMDDFEESM